jgi:molecular chaperone GrpE
LERFGIRRIEALGMSFDPTFHEAIMESEDSRAPGTVVGVMEDGYMIWDRLLRPARVIIAKNASAEPPGPEAPTHESVVQPQLSTDK